MPGPDACQGTAVRDRGPEGVDHQWCGTEMVEWWRPGAAVKNGRIPITPVAVSAPAVYLFLRGTPQTQLISRGHSVVYKPSIQFPLIVATVMPSGRNGSRKHKGRRNFTLLAETDMPDI